MLTERGRVEHCGGRRHCRRRKAADGAAIDGHINRGDERIVGLVQIMEIPRQGGKLNQGRTAGGFWDRTIAVPSGYVTNFG